MMTQPNLNGVPITYRETVAFIALPPALWREIDGGCSCSKCKDAKETDPDARSYWDTLAVPLAPANGKTDTTYMVHHP
jgi:hypothetical protein